MTLSSFDLSDVVVGAEDGVEIVRVEHVEHVESLRVLLLSERND